MCSTRGASSIRATSRWRSNSKKEGLRLAYQRLQGGVMERLDWIEGEGFEALRGQRAALVDGPVYTLLDPTEYAVAVGEGDRARLVIVHTKPESATLSIDVGENAKLSIVEMFIDEAFVECSIRQQGGSLCEVTMAELTSANVRLPHRSRRCVRPANWTVCFWLRTRGIARSACGSVTTYPIAAAVRSSKGVAGGGRPAPFKVWSTWRPARSVPTRSRRAATSNSRPARASSPKAPVGDLCRRREVYARRHGGADGRRGDPLTCGSA